MKNALVYYKGFNAIPGGSEFQPLMLAAALQKHCNVTLALGWQSDVEKACRIYGIELNLNKLKIVYVRPQNKFLLRLDTILPFYRTKKLRQLAKEADVCISAMNIMDFGKPAHAFICSLTDLGDVAFSDYVLHKPVKAATLFMRCVRRFIGEAILRPLLRMRSTRKILSDPREFIYANSFFTERTMKEFYGDFHSTVFYPPTILEIPGSSSVARNSLQVNYIGRISESKKVINIIDIVEYARTATKKDITLRIAGYVEKTPYVERIKQIIKDKPWCVLVGPVTGQEKIEFLLSGSYAVHAERDEAFGISITEYLKAGMIPIVPDEGGACEVVDNQCLTYSSDEEAGRILAKLISEDTFRNAQLACCTNRARMFSLDAYMERQDKLVEKILNG